MSDDLSKRVIEVESRLLMQERTIEQLNEVILEQNVRLEQLARQMEQFAEQLRKASPTAEGPEPPPPHY